MRDVPLFPGLGNKTILENFFKHFSLIQLFSNFFNIVTANCKAFLGPMDPFSKSANGAG